VRHRSIHASSPTDSGRYEVSKLVQLLLIREMANQVSKSDGSTERVVISATNPGAVTTNITRDPGVLLQAMTKVGQKLTCRSAEEGSRTLVYAAYAGQETHGKYLDDCHIGE
jgi:retinol dehydrogenase 12